MKFDKFSFYREYFNHYYKGSKVTYEQIIEKVSDKEILECQEESITVLTVDSISDILNHSHKLFHID